MAQVQANPKRKRPILFFILIILVCIGVASYFLYFRSIIPGKIKSGEAFHPEYNRVIKSGIYSPSSIQIPENTTVTFEGDVEINAEQDILIEGQMISNCGEIKLNAGGNFELFGSMDNSCGDSEESKDILIHHLGDTIHIGSTDKTAEIGSSGNLTIITGELREAWEYDLAPGNRSSELLPPVCTAKADQLISAIPTGEQVTFNFLAEAVDPDGGPVSYSWDFGDGGTDSGQNPIHAYTNEGQFNVTLIATDDDGQTCTSQLPILITAMSMNDENLPQEPMAWIEPSTLSAAVGEEITFSAEVFDWQDGQPNLRWITEKGSKFNTSEIHEKYSQTGIHEVTLEVTDQEGNQSYASASVYIFPQAQATAYLPKNAKPNLVNYDCTNPKVYKNDNYINLKWPKVPFTGLKGQSFDWLYWPLNGSPLYILPKSSITAGNGESQPDQTASGKGIMEGSRGGNGGSITINNIASSTVICFDTTFELGNGGKGADVLLDNSDYASRDAAAFGGDGGMPGELRINAFNGIYLQGDPAGGLNNNIRVAPGNGGNGGQAIAIAGNGTDSCETRSKGGDAIAYGGRGGKSNYVLTLPPNNRIRNNVILILDRINGKVGDAGNGGDSLAIGGEGGNSRQADGNDCTNKSCSAGSYGGDAFARGGKGGDANTRTAGAFLRGVSFNGGTGGDSRAEAGKGGDGATCCHLDKGEKGGRGGDTYAYLPVPGGKNLIGVRAAGGMAIGFAGDGGDGGSGKNEGGSGGSAGFARNVIAGFNGANPGKCQPKETRLFINFVKMTARDVRKITLRVKVRIEMILSMLPSPKVSKLTIQENEQDISRIQKVIVEYKNGTYQEIYLQAENFIDSETIEFSCNLPEEESQEISIYLVEIEGNTSDRFTYNVEIESPTPTPTSTPSPSPMPTITTAPTLEPTPAPVSTATPGYNTACLEYDIDYFGSDYNMIEMEVADPVICLQACMADQNCLTFTFVRPGYQASNARCYLKNAVPNRSGNECCVSGLRSACLVGSSGGS